MSQSSEGCLKFVPQFCPTGVIFLPIDLFWCTLAWINEEYAVFLVFGYISMQMRPK